MKSALELVMAPQVHATSCKLATHLRTLSTNVPSLPHNSMGVHEGAKGGGQKTFLEEGHML